MQIISKQSSLSLNVWPQLFVLISPSLSFCFVLFSSVKWKYRESAACPYPHSLPFLFSPLPWRMGSEMRKNLQSCAWLRALMTKTVGTLLKWVLETFPTLPACHFQIIEDWPLLPNKTDTEPHILTHFSSRLT